MMVILKAWESGFEVLPRSMNIDTELGKSKVGIIL
jgi:hypothetical protein